MAMDVQQTSFNAMHSSTKYNTGHANIDVLVLALQLDEMTFR